MNAIGQLQIDLRQLHIVILTIFIKRTDSNLNDIYWSIIEMCTHTNL